MGIEAGKFYRVRGGAVVGPMRHDYPDAVFGWREGDGQFAYDAEGRCFCFGGRDLVAEWVDADDGPVRTVTRSEIVPGVYRAIEVGNRSSDSRFVDVAFGSLWVGKAGSGTYVAVSLNADELDAAAAVLTQLAGALRDQ